MLEVGPLMVLHLRLATTQLEWICDLGRPLTRDEALWFPTQWQEREFLAELRAKAGRLGGTDELVRLIDALDEALNTLDTALVAASENGDRR